MPSTYDWKFWKKPLFSDKRFLVFMYAVLAVIASILKYKSGSLNNYLIYKNVFFHTINLKPLYAAYPTEYLDTNHYGPLFSLVIAPFALLPDYIGAILWVVFTAVFLGWSFTKLPMEKAAIAAVFFICANELFTSMVSFQFNPVTAGLIILSYTFVKDKKDFWAACCIAIGTLVKIYGIVGLVFFLFSYNKSKFIASLVFWFSVLLAAPILITSYEFILASYKDWFNSITEKSGLNVALTSYQDFSVMGIARRITQNPSISSLPFILTGLILYSFPLIRLKFYKNLIYQQFILASTLLFVVLFSSGSESPSYIIAFSGIAIWFVLQKKPVSKIYVIVFLFAFVFSSLGSTDLFPKVFRTFMRLYALKALPCLIVWLVLLYHLMTSRFVNHKQRLQAA